MECLNCGFSNRKSTRFCESCGKALSVRCAACGEVLPTGARFCGSCGARVKGATPPEAALPATIFATQKPKTYTPAVLAERILSARNLLTGERKQVTVLFADIRGSMELIQGDDPEDAQNVLDAAVRIMMDAVHRYEGTVNKVLGDGIMALFGAPIAHEDHAVRAAYAALSLQRELHAVGGTFRRRHGVEMQARVGLHSGEVVVRAIDNDLFLEYDAIGPTVHLANRLEQLAKPGRIHVTGDTLRLAEGFLEATRIGPTRIKGLDREVEVFELTGTAAARTRLQAGAQRGLTCFVGRDPEMEMLTKAFQRATDGHGQIVAIVGEPGVGKSRLFYEFARSSSTRDCVVLESHSVSFGKANPWHPIIELLKDYFRIRSDDDPRLAAERVTGKLLALDTSLKPLVAPLHAILNIAVSDPEWNRLDQPTRRQKVIHAIKCILFRESKEEPLILVFEDLHWIDAETEALLESLINSLPSNRVMLLLSYRPGYHHGWSDRTYYTQLDIDPLGGQAAERLVTALLGHDPGLAELKQILIKRTEGNPLFIEEMVRKLVETSLLKGEPGNYRLGKPVETVQVPPTVQAILAARIDRLPPDTKRVLQCAAVVGQNLRYPVLRLVAGMANTELLRELDQLQSAGILYESSLFPELAYTFKHALTQAVAYQGILQNERRALHQRVGEALETLYPDRMQEYTWAIVSHYERAGCWAKVARLHKSF